MSGAAQRSKSTAAGAEAEGARAAVGGGEKERGSEGTGGAALQRVWRRGAGPLGSLPCGA